jgi:RNA-binding protein NOB1
MIFLRISVKMIIDLVINFSKKTGDYAVLSATDLKVLALTWTLEKEACGNTEHMRKDPVRLITQQGKLQGSSKVHPATVLTPSSDDSSKLSTPPPSPCLDSPSSSSDTKKEEEITQGLESLVIETKDASSKMDETKAPEETVHESWVTPEQDDDEEGWITPNNVIKKKEKDLMKIHGASKKEPLDIPVACITTDFAMQVRHYFIMNSDQSGA